MSKLKNKIILITGACGGLGREMARQFFAEGSRLVLSDLKASALFELEHELGNREQVLLSIESDLSTSAGCKKVYDAVLANHIEIDILVNNAAICCIGDFLKTPDEQWEKQYAINLLAPVRLTKLFLPEMVKRNSGHLVNISSVASFTASPGLATYSSTKFALRAFGEAMSEELKTTNVRVTNLYPFATNTPLLSSPQYGYSEPKKFPDFMTSSPEDVIRDLIDGIKGDKLHVLPGVMAKTTEFMSRLAPKGIQIFFDLMK